MLWLKIENPGTADWQAFTLLGVSTSRNSGRDGVIGMFGTGSKQALALFLRNNIRVVIYCGLLRMEFFTKPEVIGGKTFNRIYVKFSGTDEQGNTKNSTESLGFTTEMGTIDWKNLNMGLREWFANSLDGALCAGYSHKDIEHKIVDKPRATKDTTKVFIEYTSDVEKAYRNINITFLHFQYPDWVNKKILPKRFPEQKKTLVYKKGVLVCYIDEEGLYDYNFGDEVELDESRNIDTYTAKYQIARLIRDSSPDILTPILRAIMEGKTYIETKLDISYLSQSSYSSKEVQESRSKNWKESFTRVAGQKAIACGDSVATISFIQNKGYKPASVGNLLSVLQSYGIPTEEEILSKDEMEGRVIGNPTIQMTDSLNWVWGLLCKLNLTNGKQKPEVKGFVAIREANQELNGYYKDGVVYLNTLLGGDDLKKTCLHETAHHIVQATDLTRTWADFLLRVGYECAKLFMGEESPKPPLNTVIEGSNNVVENTQTEEPDVSHYL